MIRARLHLLTALLIVSAATVVLSAEQGESTAGAAQSVSETPGADRWL